MSMNKVYPLYAVITRLVFWPPNPKEFDKTALTRALRLWLGTTSKGIAGSGSS